MLIDSDILGAPDEINPQFQTIINSLAGESDRTILAKRLKPYLVWDRPRTRFTYWVPVVNSIDRELTSLVSKYGLQEEHPKLQLFSPEDETVVITFLRFTTTLLENTTGSEIYNSADNVYHLVKSGSLDVRLAAMEVALCIAETFAETSLPNLAASKEVKNMVLKLARSFPPMVPLTFTHRKLPDTDDSNTANEADDRPVVLGDHFCLVDTITTGKKYPSKWGSLSFPYYITEESLQPSALPKKGTSGSKKSKSTEDAVSHTGLQRFNLSEELVRKLSLEQIYDRASIVIPPTNLFDFSLAATTAKAFNTRSYDSWRLREILLKIKCLLIGYISSMCSSLFTSSRLLEVEPYSLSFMVELIQPDNDSRVPKDVYYAAVRSLQVISAKKAWGPDLMRCMGGNVSHGMLFHCLRNIYKQLVDNSPDYFERGSICFLHMLGNLIRVKGLAAKLAAGNILSDLLPFLSLRSSHKRTISAVVNYTSMYCRVQPEACTDFIDQDGFKVLIDTIKYEVDSAMNKPEPEKDRPLTETQMYHRINYRQANYIRNLMRFVVSLIESDLGDRLRNLFDTPILQSFNKILMNQDIFGPLIVSATVDSVFDIIHNEPTAYAILNEANVIANIVRHYAALFLPSTQLILSLAEVLGAICLNKEGLALVIECKCIEIFFEYLLHPNIPSDFTKEACNPGSSFEELSRHYPVLRPVIVDQIKGLLEKLLVAMDDGDGAAQLFSQSENTTLLAFPSDTPSIRDDFEMPFPVCAHSRTIKRLDNVMFFLGGLGGLLQDSGKLSEGVLASVPVALWIDVISHKIVPFDFVTSDAFSTVMWVLKILDDEDTKYGFMDFTLRVCAHTESPVLREFLLFEDTNESYFEKRFSSDIQGGTIFLRELNSLHSLLYATIEAYMSLEASHPQRYDELVRSVGSHPDCILFMGKLLCRCVIEETLIRESLPQEVAAATIPRASRIAGKFKPQLYTNDPKEPRKSFKDSRVYNAKQVRFLLLDFQSLLTTFFRWSGRVCLEKRDIDAWSLRTQSVQVTTDLAQIFAHALAYKFDSLYRKVCFIYAISSLFKASLMLQHHGMEVCLVPSYMLCFQSGVFDGFRQWTRELWLPLIEDTTKADFEIIASRNYIGADLSSVLSKAFSNLIEIFEKPAKVELWCSFSEAKFFFEMCMWVDDPEAAVRDALTVQMQYEALVVLKYIVGSASTFMLNDTKIEQIAHLPFETIKLLQRLCTNAVSSSPELSNVTYYPLDVVTMFPSSQKIKSMSLRGIRETSAIEFFRARLKFQPDNPNQVDIIASIPPYIGERVCPMSPGAESEFKSAFSGAADVSRIVDEREIEKSAFIKVWLDVVSSIPEMSGPVSKLVRTIETTNKALINLLDMFRTLEALQPEKATACAAIVKELCGGGPGILEVDSFLYFTEYLSTRLEGKDSITDPRILVALSIFSQSLAWNVVPKEEHVQYPGTSLSTTPLDERIPGFLDNHMVQNIFKSLTQVAVVTDQKLATLLTEILILFATDFDMLEQIACSKLLKQLVAFPRCCENSGRVSDDFRKALTILLRRCYETKRVLTTTFQTILPRASYFPKQHIWRVLEAQASLVLRSPSIYTDEVSKLIYLEDFTGEKASTSVCRLPISRQTPIDSSPEENAGPTAMAPVYATGVVHLLLAQLMNAINTDWLTTPAESDVAKATAPENDEPKKCKDAGRSRMKEAFKNVNFAYICFLVQTLAELLGSYKQSKLEFLTFTRKKNEEDIKTRSTALNFFLHRLIPARLFEKNHGVEHDRRHAVSTLAKNALVSLISSPITEKSLGSERLFEDADVSFIRLFFLDVLTKLFRDVSVSKASTSEQYGKLFDIMDLCVLMLSPKVRESLLCDKQTTKDDVYFIAKGIIDKLISAQVASVLGELDLNFPDVKRLIRVAIKLLDSLGSVKHEYHRDFEDGHQGEKEDDDVVPDEDDDGEETQDLLRNSTLGMYEIESASDSDLPIDYYDGDPLEGEEVDSDEESSEMSGFDSGLESEFGHHVGASFGDNEDEGSLIGTGDDENDEDNMDFDSEMSSGSENEDIEGEGSRFFGFGEEEASSDDYDDGELDQWMERFGGGLDAEMSGNDAELNVTNDESVMNGCHRDTRRNMAFLTPRSDADVTGSEDEDEEEMPHPITGMPIHRPRGAPEIASLLNRFVGEGAILQGHIMINGTRHSLGHFDNVLDHAFGPNLQFGRLKNKSEEEGSNFMTIRSTRERWQETVDMFPDLSATKSYLRVGPTIINRLADISIEIQDEKIAKAERLKKERDDRLRKIEQKKKKLLQEAAAQREAAVTENRTEPSVPIMMRIGDREVDISGTEIDPEFFEALPDDMREEVFTQHVRERRATASSSGLDSREIDPDFLNALPDEIREEILLQEMVARRFSSLGSGRFGDLYDENAMDIENEMDDISDEAMEEDSEEDSSDEDDADEDEDDEESDDDAQIEDEDEERPGANHEVAEATSQFTGQFHDDSALAAPESLSDAEAEEDIDVARVPIKTPKRVFFTPLFDRQGTASVLRLLFAPLAINQREDIYQTLHLICFNKQTRGDVINMVLAILHDGKADQRSLERIYSQLCARATGIKDSNKSAKLPLGISPLAVAIQIMEALDYLLERNSHMRFYLLMEHDNPFLIKKVNPKEKILGISPKEAKYPINLLLETLEVPAYREDQTFMDILARVLQIATRRLQTIRDSKDFPFSPPIIPDHNYRRIIQILTSNDCSNTTFRRTISAMQNFSLLGHSQKLFSLELSEQASLLGHTIIGDVIKLTHELQKGADFNIETKTFSKFRAASSDQAKLLRVLTALDYMYESREKENGADETSRSNLVSDIEELTALYQNLALGSLWDALSDCLQALDGRSELVGVSTALLPLIEALMVVCKHSKVKDYQIKDALKYEAKKIDFANEPIESLFFTFTDEHKKILNQMVRTNPNLMSGPFGMLVRNPRVLEFDNKRNFFDRMLHKERGENAKLAISVRRDQVFLDSYRSLFFKSKGEFSNSKFDINFKGEAGVDAGGVTREWYQVLSRQMFNPDYALFTPASSDKTTFHPNRTSYVNPEHLSFFKFIGRIIGKAIYDGCFLDCHFSRAVYKRLLNRPVSLKDMETLDLDYSKSLTWMLENDITDVITETFSVETDDYGEHKTIDLIEGGRDVPVTEDNKSEYVRKVVEYRLQTSVAEQMDHFLEGFHDIIPENLVVIFDEQELELLISGLPDISVADWQNNTVYTNYSASSMQIQWFWRAVKSFDNEERAKLLQFATGTSKVPLNGFKELSGSDGACKFSIHRDYCALDRLPSSHTCFNQIDLPAYESYETLRGSLLMAITEGHEGFGLA